MLKDTDIRLHSALDMVCRESHGAVSLFILLISLFFCL